MDFFIDFAYSIRSLYKWTYYLIDVNSWLSEFAPYGSGFRVSISTLLYYAASIFMVRLHSWVVPSYIYSISCLVPTRKIVILMSIDLYHLLLQSPAIHQDSQEDGRLVVTQRKQLHFNKKVQMLIYIFELWNWLAAWI